MVALAIPYRFIDLATIVNGLVVGLGVPIITGAWIYFVRASTRHEQQTSAVIYLLDHSRRHGHDIEHLKANCPIRIPPPPSEWSIPPKIKDYAQDS